MLNLRNERNAMIERIHEAVRIIDESLAADDFNEEDREVVEKNREFFKEQVAQVRRMGAQSLKASDIAA